MPALTHDTPQINQTSYAHNMMGAMASYLDAIAIGNTEVGRGHLGLARDLAAGAVRSALYSTNEHRIAQDFAEVLDKVVLV